MLCFEDYCQEMVLCTHNLLKFYFIRVLFTKQLLKTLDVVKVFVHKMSEDVLRYFSTIFALFWQTTLKSISKLV